MAKTSNIKTFLAEGGFKKGKEKIFLKDARIFDPESGYDKKGNLLIIKDRIADFGNIAAPKDAEIIDCKGLLLAPGLIDIQVHAREPGFESKENFTTVSRTAAVGGVTSIAVMPNTKPVTDNVMIVEYIKKKAKEKSLVNIHIFASITKNMEGKELSEIGLLKEAGVVGITDDGLPCTNSQIMRNALAYAGEFGMVVSQHAEDTTLHPNGVMNEGKVSARLGLKGIPNASESIMVARDLELLRLVQKETGKGHYHVLHVSTAESIELIRAAKKEGLNVTCETAPHYFSLTDEAVEEYRTFAKMNPPLRNEKSRKAIYDAVCDGTIDAIATDHAPHDEESKRLPFADAAFGIVGLETMLPLSLELYHNGDVSLRKLLAALTYKPADILKIKRGRISKGAVADLTLIDLDTKWKIDPEKFYSKSKNSPFLNRPVKGRAVKTFVAGRLVYSYGS